MLDGLYKVEYGVNDAFGRSIMCMHGGKLLGGNSAFAHLGTYRQRDDGIAAELITEKGWEATTAAEINVARQSRRNTHTTMTASSAPSNSISIEEM